MRKFGSLVFGCGLVLALGACNERTTDEVVIEYRREKVFRCWMLKKGDRIPSDHELNIDRARITVLNGDWDEALRRVGLSAEQCSRIGK